MLIGPNQTIAVLIGILGYVMDWYGLILLTPETKAEEGLPKLTKSQKFALIFAVSLGTVAWLRNLCVVQGDKTRVFAKPVRPVRPLPLLQQFVFGDSARR